MLLSIDSVLFTRYILAIDGPVSFRMREGNFFSLSWLTKFSPSSSGWFVSKDKFFIIASNIFLARASSLYANISIRSILSAGSLAATM